MVVVDMGTEGSFASTFNMLDEENDVILSTEMLLDKIGYVMRFSRDFLCEDNVSNNRKCAEVHGEFNVHRRLIPLKIETNTTEMNVPVEF